MEATRVLLGESVGVFVDAGYRTRLGVPFYDRRSELEALDSSVRTYRLTIVYGPRNVGKSELVYYWSRRRARRRVIAFQVDLVRAERVVEGVDKYLAAPEERVKEVVLSELRKVVLERLSLLSLAYAVYDAVRVLGGEAVLFLDEFHLLPRYGASKYQRGYAEALADLEALAHRLAKDEEDRLRVVVTASEGFVATGEALSRLHGYSTDFLLVEHMDEQHFSALYEEYRNVKGCSTDYHVVHGVAGGAPGYLAELCRGEHAVARFIERSKSVLESGLSSARSALSAEPWRSTVGRLEPRQLISLAYEVASGVTVSPVEQPLLYSVGQLLTTYNIVYPSYEKGQVRFKPQIPLYQVLLEIAVEKKASSILGIEVGEVLRRVKRVGCRAPTG